jgi:radical SAM protein with 4Fe4S-binding SPASM domain
MSSRSNLMNIIKKTASLGRMLFNFKKRKTVLDTMPVRLWIESSFACNLQCIMCPNKEIAQSDKGVMSFDLFKKIIDEAKVFVNDVYLHHRGEPLINNDLFRMISYAKMHGLAVRFHTNGCLLSEDKAIKLIDAGPDMVSFSFDGFQKDIYEEVRQGAKFDRTVANIVRFCELKKQKKSSKPYVVIEKIDFLRYADRYQAAISKKLEDEFTMAGVDEIIVKKEYEWVTPETEINITEFSYNVCTFPWYAMVICWDGTVTPCPQDYKAGIRLGNVTEKSIRQIWNDEPYQELRYNLSNDINSLSLCKKCDRLCRKGMGGVPFQYLITFLVDHYAGYGRLRKLIGTQERN